MRGVRAPRTMENAAREIRRTFQPIAATAPIEPTTGSLNGIDRVQTVEHGEAERREPAAGMEPSHQGKCPFGPIRGSGPARVEAE